MTHQSTYTHLQTTHPQLPNKSTSCRLSSNSYNIDIFNRLSVCAVDCRFCDCMNPRLTVTAAGLRDSETDFETDRICRGYLCIYNFIMSIILPLVNPQYLLTPTYHLFSGNPFVYIGASCVENSLIAGSVKGQYATKDFQKPGLYSQFFVLLVLEVFFFFFVCVYVCLYPGSDHTHPGCSMKDLMGVMDNRDEW